MADIVTTLFSPRIHAKELSQLCRRLGTSLAAGVDVRTTWKREASGAGRAATLRRYGVIRDAVAAGDSMAEGIDCCDDFFPPLFRQLARVGEETGSGAEVFRRLADHYDAGLKRRRIFLAAISWPMIQLTAAVVVVGLVIWIMGMIGDGKTDVFRFGLTGARGLRIYVAFVALVAGGVMVVIRALQRGLAWIRPVQRIALKVPVLGPALETLALSRLAWVMHLTTNTGMDIRQAMRLSLESTNYARYLDQIPVIDRWIEQGGSLYEAFVQAGNYPAEFLDALQVGEESGRLGESMRHLSEQYEDRARLATVTLMTLAGFFVWALVAAIIIFMIFRLFSFYLGVLNSAGNR
jgi:type II secretory pathway component PulF